MEPDFSNITSSEMRKFNSFFEKTEPTTIQKTSSNLNELTCLFYHNNKMLSSINPISCNWEIRKENDYNLEAALNWELDMLSKMKERLGYAIQYKREYYKNHRQGKVNRFFLKLFKLWNDGLSPTIEKAENKLLETDSRNRLVKTKEGFELYPPFFTFIPPEMYNTTNFYNYDPKRRIPLGNNRYWENGIITNI